MAKSSSRCWRNETLSELRRVDSPPSRMADSMNRTVATLILTLALVLSAAALYLVLLRDREAPQRGAASNRQAGPPAFPAAADGPGDSTTDLRLSEGELQAKLQDACTYCHAYAQADTIPRGLWEKELRLAYGFIADSDLDAQRVPPFDQALAHFRERAPVRFEIPAVVASPSPIAFRPRHFETWVTHHAVAHIQCVPELAGARNVGVICDMRNSKVFACYPADPERDAEILAEGGRPCHSEAADLDGDGVMDLLVADLGTLQASDDLEGKVVWLQGDKEGGFTRRVLLDGIGRVADVRAADFDADGDLDLVVGVFGWRHAGRLLYLENQTQDYASPQFISSVLDPRIGVIHTPIADLNQDGRPDFVALFAQHHEQVVAFLNEGGGKFRQEAIFEFDNPGFGSTGVELVDMDQDGDLDVLLTNGDTLDFEIYRPYHGVRWLENTGDGFPFTHHPLLSLPGAMSAAAGDLDLDGDMDVAAVSLLPFGIIDPETNANLLPGRGESEGAIPSLVWMEQTSPGVFATHVLENNLPAHATVSCRDMDDDGDLDLVTGYFTLEGVTGRAVFLTPFPGAMTVWENPTRTR